MSKPHERLGHIAMALLFGDQRFTDLHFESNRPVMMRRAGNEWVPAMDENGREVIVTHEDILHFVHGSFNHGEPMPSTQATKPQWLQELFKVGALNHACNLGRQDEQGRPTSEICRVRCTIQLQFMREAVGLVMRPLREVPESLEKLGLPDQLSGLLEHANNGLLLVTGPTGSGKSTTLAAMVNQINEHRHANILTLEDPVEFEHERKKGIINQRELGVDVASFEVGVRDALRFVPDVILIGEIRDSSTMRAALRAAESGHLVLSSTHAPTTVGAVRKMVSYLAENPGDVQALASCLVGVVAQALVRNKSPGGGSELAYELLDAREAAVGNAIRGSSAGGDELKNLENQLREKQLRGSISMAESLRRLVRDGKVDPRRAAGVALHPNDRQEFMNSSMEARPRSGVASGGSALQRTAHAPVR